MNLSLSIEEASFSYLSRRSHSVAELKQKLQRKGYSAEEIDGEIGRLLERGYLDDSAYAEGLIARRARVRGWAAIAAELRAKGISRELIESHLAQRLSDEDQLEAARRVAESWPLLDSAKLSGRLQRRGFESSIIQKIVGARRAEPD